MHGILSIGGENRLLIAVSVALRPIEIETGINEFDSCLDCSVTFFTRPTAPLSSYSTVIRLALYRFMNVLRRRSAGGKPNAVILPHMCQKPLWSL